jgi:hypothetical protein
MASYQRLRECINRLTATSVTVKLDSPLASGRKGGFANSLVRKFAWDEEAIRGSSQRWKVWLEKDIIRLFDDNSFTKIDWEQRLRLPPLAKWLHQFYFTHSEPYAVKVATIKTLCGSRIAELNKFRYKLKESLTLLKEEGFLLAFAVDPRTDLVSVKRAPRRKALASVCPP